MFVLATLFALDAAQVGRYALMFVRATCGAFHWPAMQASTTLMVPGSTWLALPGLNQARREWGPSSARRWGHAIGGTANAGHPVIDVATALLAIGTLSASTCPSRCALVQRRRLRVLRWWSTCAKRCGFCAAGLAS